MLGFFFFSQGKKPTISWEWRNSEEQQGGQAAGLGVEGWGAWLKDVRAGGRRPAPFRAVGRQRPSTGYPAMTETL